MPFYWIHPGVDLKWSKKESKRASTKKSLYLECCHSGSGLGRAKIGRVRAFPLTNYSFRTNVHSNILMYCWRLVHLFESCHSGCLFFWLNCLLLVIRWAIKGPWASSWNQPCHLAYQNGNPYFLVHLSRRLKWAIVIALRPSSVRPSVRRPSSSVVVVRKLSHFQLLLQNRSMDFDETWYAWSTHGLLQVLLFFRPDPPRGGSRAGQK